MFWSKLCKSNWNCAWNFAFPVFISPIVWNMCENLHYESVYFKELNNEQEYYWPTIYRAGAAVVSTVITSCYSFLLLRRAVFGVFSNTGAQKLNRGFLPLALSFSPIFSPQFSFCEAVRIHSTKHKRFKSPRRREVTDFCASRKQLIIKKYSSEIGLISTP